MFECRADRGAFTEINYSKIFCEPLAWHEFGFELFVFYFLFYSFRIYWTRYGRFPLIIRATLTIAIASKLMQIHFTEVEKEMFIYKLDTENCQKLHNERQ